MKEYASVAVPELVDLDFELAGPGARIGALVIDLALMSLMAFVLIFSFILVLGISFSATTSEWSTSFTVAIIVFGIFLLQWGYFIAFEFMLNGQTPGKRLMGIRVIMENGLPIDFKTVVIRNLMRVADSLPPGTYLLAGFTAIFDDRGRRMGDMAAKTIVIHETFATNQGSHSELGSNWIAKVESGQSRYALVLPRGKLNINQLAVLERYQSRAFLLSEDKRRELAIRILSPILPLLDKDPQAFAQNWSVVETETIIEDLLNRARTAPKPKHDDSQQTPQASAKIDAGEKKRQLWQSFAQETETLLRQGRRALQLLTESEIAKLLVNYRLIVTDLARAQSLGADRQTKTFLNRLAVSGHNLIYGQAAIGRPRFAISRDWWAQMAIEVRNAWQLMLLSALLFFLPAIICYYTVQWFPDLGYDLVPTSFLNFEPASTENIHDIPSVWRPLVSTQIITNNWQVSFLAFGLGLTGGLGTSYVLITNGIHIGSVIGWMAYQGSERALWGWVMPHGGTEILAIILAGGAGFMLAKAIIAPGQLRRATALGQIATKALVVEAAVVIMLLIAGLIEGFVSPSDINYSSRIAILTSSLGLWAIYLTFAGRGATQTHAPIEHAPSFGQKKFG